MKRGAAEARAVAQVVFKYKRNASNAAFPDSHVGDTPAGARLVSQRTNPELRAEAPNERVRCVGRIISAATGIGRGPPVAWCAASPPRRLQKTMMAPTTAADIGQHIRHRDGEKARENQ